MARSIEIPTTPKLREAITSLPKAYFVGGCVRDALIGSEPKDLDIEVHEMNAEDLQNILSAHGKIDVTGASFQVIKVTIPEEGTFDFSLPRRENKTPEGGHRGFITSADPFMGIKEASRRRDFTINSIAVNTKTGEVEDPFNGIEDLKNGVLRAVDAKTFAEDPLRVLRAMQFSGRFGLKPDPDTAKLCQSLAGEFHTLAKERVLEEWFKWATKSTMPSCGLQTLKDTGWMALFPEIDGLEEIPQEPEWHPEGNVLNHTMHCVDALCQNPEWKELPEDRKAITLLAILCHDLGKKTHTQINEQTGRITSHGHEPAGVEPAGKFLERIGAPKKWIAPVQTLVTNHMVYLQVQEGQNPTGAPLQKRARHLARELHEAGTNWKELLLVILADHSGRPPLPAKLPEKAEHIQTAAIKAGCLNSNPVCPVLGRDLIELGFEPGPDLGKLLKALDQAHLDEGFYNKQAALGYFKNKVVKIHSIAGLKPAPWLDFPTCTTLCLGNKEQAGKLYQQVLTNQLNKIFKSPEEALEKAKIYAQKANEKLDLEPSN